MNKIRKLEKTGERMIDKDYKSNKNDYFIYLCHIATYHFAKNYIKDKNVLEFGCGSGYGSNMLADHCRQITAVDISYEAIEYAVNNYKKSNLLYEVIDNIELSPLKYPDSSFDVVVSFQVIEHISKTDAYMKELFRVLKPGGKIIIVTPDRTLRLFSFQKPWNIYHIKEFDMRMLKKSIREYFLIEDSFYMSARDDIVKMEIKRTKKLRLFFLPFTLFFIPNNIRVFFIRLIKNIFARTKDGKKIETFEFTVDDIIIHKNPEKSVNLFVVAEKSN